MSEILTREEYEKLLNEIPMTLQECVPLLNHDAALRAEVAALNDGARRNAALLAEKREEVAALRAEIALLKQEREFAREVDRDAVEVAELRAEVERLKRELADERETSDRAVLYYSDQHARTQSAEARAEKAEAALRGAMDRHGKEYALRIAAEARAEKAETEVERLRENAFAAEVERGVANARAEKAERERDEAVVTASRLLNIALCDGCLLGEAGKHLHLSDEDNERLAEIRAREERCCDVHAMAPEQGHHEGCPNNSGTLRHQRDAAEARAEKAEAEVERLRAVWDALRDVHEADKQTLIDNKVRADRLAAALAGRKP